MEKWGFFFPVMRLLDDPTDAPNTCRLRLASTGRLLAKHMHAFKGAALRGCGQADGMACLQCCAAHAKLLEPSSCCDDTLGYRSESLHEETECVYGRIMGALLSGFVVSCVDRFVCALS